jgi:hypothetical protein
MWRCCWTRTPATPPGLAAAGRGDDPVVAAEAVAEVEPAGHPVGQGKDVISANKQYATIDEQVERFLGHLRSLSNQEALHTSGVLSKKFWLRGALSK